MLFNKDYLFIHVPRTAGKCIKSSILNHLDSPRYLCQIKIDKNIFNKNSYIHYSRNVIRPPAKGSTHLSLNEIVEQNFIWPEGLWENGIDFNKIKIILCARNPYDRLKSLFKLRLSILKRMNISEYYSFESFISEKLTKDRLFRSTYEYCNINGEMPKNLHFIRYSNLNEDLSNLFGVEINTEITRHNEIYKLNLEQQKKLYGIKDKDKAVELINQWESWGIENKLFEPVTKDMLL